MVRGSGRATYPSTSPLFLPRDAKSGCSSTPAKVPFLPWTVPMKRTVPCMFPGTSTVSPSAALSPDIAPALGVKGESTMLLLLLLREEGLFRVARA